LRKRALRDELFPLQLFDPVLQFVDLGFVDFQRHLGRRGECSGLCGSRGFLSSGQPHDGDHQKRESNEKPGLNVLGQKTLRLRCFFLYLRGLVHGFPSVRSGSADERQLFFADGEIARVDDLRSDVDAVLDLEADQIGFPVLQLVESRFLTRRTPDVGKRIVVVNRCYLERLSRGLWIEDVVEVEFRRVSRAKMIFLVGNVGFGSVNLIGCLRAQ
jgi:hypothetical protein